MVMVQNTANNKMATFFICIILFQIDEVFMEIMIISSDRINIESLSYK
ncbi:hypothetical protein SAMN04488024_102380 [Pedobacter soli]|uniref:Uncharacterized protein n=1 Tax=Pedobacter soli TaxID=390242 RepID=A0A1G6MLE7_9SPHI|nr:hypothetical protein SAMN04488024_102380 [Pedobacter soli]